MKDLREIIAGNIVRLRVQNGLTQTRFAELFNYSDKAVSKWERAESLPDITVIKQIADYFGVSVDTLLTEESGDLPKAPRSPRSARVHFYITALSVLLVFILATVAFVFLHLLCDPTPFPLGLLFLYAIPTSQVVLIVLNSIWGRRSLNYLFISILVWSVLLSVYLTLLTLGLGNPWLLFLLGPPAQLAVILWSGVFRK